MDSQPGIIPTAASPAVPQHSLAGRIISFARILKDHGFTVSTPSVIDACRGVSYIGVERRSDFKALLKALFMTRAEETVLFDRLFEEFWSASAPDRRVDLPDIPRPEPGTTTQLPIGADVRVFAGPDEVTQDLSEMDEEALAEAGISDSQEQQARNEQPYVVYSPVEVLRQRDFRDVPEGDDPVMDRLIASIVAPLLRRTGARRRPASSGTRLDLRKALRRSLLHGGEIVDLPRFRQRPRLKKLVFLCDVSGSMDPYLRFMLRFIREIQQLPTRVETFVFATRLTRITPMLTRLPFQRSLKEIAASVRDWSGGTRIGECLHQFTSLYGGSMLRPSTVMIIHSDGWDRGAPELLEAELIKISRTAYRLIWVNPLLGMPSYEPICRGMRTALPYLDAFLPGHNVAGLERTAGTLRAVL
ncbi:MAG: VWA domain-containing protein [Desulfomonile sp.]|nr:VWA domain-containing protein [Desulfomonile sp.]